MNKVRLRGKLRALEERANRRLVAAQRWRRRWAPSEWGLQSDDVDLSYMILEI